LNGNRGIKEALWEAIKSRRISVSEQSNLLDICWILYDPVYSMIVSLKLPRYWKVEKLSKACCTP
jgi:transcription initiation factor TFIID subunit 2